MRRAMGYGLMGVGVLLIVPMWFALGENSIYSAGASMTVPVWAVGVVGLGFVGLGNFLRGPSLKKRKERRLAEATASEEERQRVRAVLRSPTYQALDQRAKQLSDAADEADEAGEIQRRDALRDEAHKAGHERDALRLAAHRRLDEPPGTQRSAE